MRFIKKIFTIILVICAAIWGAAYGRKIADGDYSLPTRDEIPFLNQVLDYVKQIVSADHLSYELSPVSLREAHKNYPATFYRKVFQPEDTGTPPADIFNLVNYPAKDGNLAAFLSPDPKDGKKHPAVIWLHGGYGGIGDFFWEDIEASNDQSGKGLRDAGIIMMVPSFRGENHNPGTFEMFMGELDDLQSALDYLKSQPYVDKDRIYLIGHSTGGTNTLLGNEYIDGFRAAFSLGGIPDLKLRLQYGRISVGLPFVKTDEALAIRSPRLFINDIKSPTFYFEGSEGWWDEFEEVARYAQNKQIPFFINKVPNADHFNYLQPAVALIAQKINADTGEASNISFSEAELNEISKNIVRE
ncbi:prolyl oligopeptidase family serine peptidase [Bartonella sp. HY329]|uniref:alpha/beta hydrolase family protein n=1 Tax=unclassified Bartonella TaxID=2645622 RepID=UPI0021C9BCCA|nr:MULTISPECIES: prolyl oligopeptidase family serine peptidase [unclassified Bartonella]UXM95969.1 prolyl oligopeptidase family serine peptidase [Bartonella sp. HY329]UXN10294.1 prolyl oligopeptidase family serine peptidase [Bartonella sp. HY328]